jgi:hypothetical protein
MNSRLMMKQGSGAVAAVNIAARICCTSKCLCFQALFAWFTVPLITVGCFQLITHMNWTLQICKIVKACSTIAVPLSN